VNLSNNEIGVLAEASALLETPATAKPASNLSPSSSDQMCVFDFSDQGGVHSVPPKLHRKATGFYECLGDLFTAELPESDEIIFGGRRGQLSMLVSVTNLGKTTLMLNMAVMAAAGEAFPPLLEKPRKPIRTMILDMEATGKELQGDLTKMIEGVPNREEILKNIVPVVDAEIDDEILDLSNPTHYKFVCEKAKAAKIDLLIVDTCSSAFEIEDENSNAEVKRAILLPLKRLAREANCHVLFSHHIGKTSENPARRIEASYRGRGASAFGALSRAVFTVTSDSTLGTTHIVLTCAKVKGPRFENATLFLDQSTRWFRLVSGSAPRPNAPSVDEVVAFIVERGEALTAEIYEQFAGRTSPRTIDARLAKASVLGLIQKANQNSPWRGSSPSGHVENPQFATAIEIADCGSVN
jgi:hypothetical protein